MTQTIHSNDPVIVWQEEPNDGIAEQPLLVESYSDVISITQREASININFGSVDELCKLLKAMKKENEAETK